MSKLGEVRALFNARLKAGIPDPPGSFDPRDLERVESDKYLHRLLEHHENNAQGAADMLWDIMVWRRTEKINDICEKTVNMDCLKQGVFFPRGRDIDSCLIFIMKGKRYIKGQTNVPEMKKIILYWLERLEREEDGKKLTMFFDMDGCGLSNMDLDIIMYMVTVFKNYYPNFINYIIVFSMPWILSAGFKLVKSILPAKAVERLKTVGKDKLKEIIAPEQALTCWGGKDDYEFVFVPESRGGGEMSSKKVSFKENGNPHSLGELLSLNTNVIDFISEGDEISGEFSVTNMDENAISFKIRTTAPEKYRVRPSAGILPPGKSQTIQIFVQTGFNVSCVNKDKFLVLALQIPKIEMSQKELVEIWQNSARSKIDEYRLKCQSLLKENITALSDERQESEPIALTIKKIQDSNNLLHKKIKQLKMYQFISIFFTAIGILLSIILYNKTSNDDSYCTKIT